ncbi:hypothetical protein GOP47_0015841 [Adiantum capillus-veneris]|uniref:Tetratricopeptide repeat protein n=1 Tax=Adiantum capillus-veneris TaxID=13818 RepID=A0A9D4UKG6_ADICA|nr:hypothetical protein GOP47_0015841 [Adiantum capillus-veneris]
MARMLRSLFGASNQHHQTREEGSMKHDFRNMRYNDLFDLYINDDDADQRPPTSCSSVAAISADNRHYHHLRKVSEPFCKGEFTVYDHIVGLSRPPSASGSQAEVLIETPRCPSAKARSRTPTPQALALWRPPSVGRSTNLSARSGTPGDGSRPMTAVRAAGYSSRGSKFDSSSQGSRALTPVLQRRDESSPEIQLKELERLVHKLLEESATAAFNGDLITALEKAKEAGKKERLLCRHREQAGLIEQMNMDLTFSVCFNLAYQYERRKLFPEALSTYSQIIKNKQFVQGGRLRINMGNIYYEQGNYVLAIKMYRMALDQTPNSYKETRFRIMRNIGNVLMRIGEYQDAMQSFEAVMEIKYDHQAGYNLIVCYYIVGNTEKMKSCFTKMLLVRHYDPEIDEDLEEDSMAVSKNDELLTELQSRQCRAHKYIFTAARIIAPVIGGTFVEGYDWVINILKDQQYVTLAHEMEMDKAIHYLHKRKFGNAISLLKTFERKERDLMICASTNLSFVYFLEGDIDNAKRYAELALSTNQLNPCALVNLGNCLFTKDDAEGAATLYQKAIDLQGDFMQASYNLGLAQRKLGLLSESLDTFRQLAKTLPNNAEILYQVGHLNDLMGNTQQAIQWLEIVITSVMHDAGILATLGSLFTKCNNETKALYYYNESHRVHPVNMDIITFLGAFYVQHELYEKAIPIFKLASNIQSEEVKWQLMIASCYRRTGSYSAAIAKHKEILIQHPNNIECLRKMG